MSYILDALLKADQERQRNATPTLHSVHAPHVIEPPSRRKRWFYPVLAALLSGGLLSSVVLLSMRPAVSAPERSPQARTATSSAADTASREMNTIPSPPQPASLSTPLPAVTGSPPAKRADAAAQPSRTAPPPTTVATIARSAPAASEKHAVLAAVPSAASREAAWPPAPPADTPPAANPKPSNRVLDIGELPLALRKEVEESVIVSGSSFAADSNERMAIINDRARRAGDEVAAGMKLETILPDGIVLNYKGYRFRTGMY